MAEKNKNIALSLSLREIHASIQDTSSTDIEKSTFSGGFTGSSLQENDVNKKIQRKRYLLREPEKRSIDFIAPPGN